MWITSSLEAAKAPTNIALGNFDGVHLGHQQVMAQILARPLSTHAKSSIEIASEIASTSASTVPSNGLRNNQSLSAFHSGVLASGYSQLPTTAGEVTADLSASTLAAAPELPTSGAYATVVTFSPHPHEYFSGTARPLLTPVAENAWQLAQLGIHQLVMLPFNHALAELSPQEFVEKILIRGLKAQRISVGSDFHFGKGRSGNAQMLMDIAAAYGVPVVLVPLKHEKGDRISSSRIREALQSGSPTTATQLLGRPYTLTGRVVQGKQLGRTIGFPTANLQLPAKKFLPCTGVYSVRIYGTPNADAEPLKGVMNIGHRPTVNGQTLSIEVHILNWAGDLYGKMLTVSLESFVRAEQKFDSLDALKSQIAKDRDIAAATL